MRIALVRNDSHRLETVDQLRGLAALAVGWYHFTNVRSFLPEGWIKESGSSGWLGVEVFFVISGFILPWALYRAGYRLRHFARFLAKRILRLDPPYLVTLVLLIGLAFLGWARHGFQADQLHLSFPQVFLHLGYLNAFFGYEWLSPVFWTLAIEFQYYLLLGLLFPLLIHTNMNVRLSALSVLGALAFVFPQSAFVFHFMFLFLLGIATFYRKTGQIGNRTFLALLIVFGIGCTCTLSPLIAIVGAATATSISYTKLNIRPLRFLSRISYSFYLLHGTIGGILITQVMRVTENPSLRITFLPVIFGLSILGSWVLYRWVELPAQRWSSSIRYSSVEKETFRTNLPGDAGIAA